MALETINYEELYQNFSISEDFQNFLIEVTDYYFPDVQIYLPLHLISFIFMLLMLWNLHSNPYLHSRPRSLFLISGFFFTLAAGYNLLYDIGYLYLRGKTVSIQTCSIATSFMSNPLSVTGLIDAIDRYIVIFGKKPLRVRWLFLMYLSFPLISIIASIYELFISTSWIKYDMICLITRSNEWIDDALFAIQWGTILIAMLLYFIIWRKLLVHTNMLKQTYPEMMTQEKYYRDKQVVRLFFICCSVPVFLVFPIIIIRIVNELFEIRHRLVTLLGWVLFDTSIPFIWGAYLIFVPSLRKRICDIFQCKNAQMGSITMKTTFATPPAQLSMKRTPQSSI